ncbi:MAG: hypothetical protein ACOH1Y_09855 [Propionicimonas sp.]
MSDKSITTDLMTRLRRHYIKPSDPLPGGIFVHEVGFNGGGTRRCDAIFVGFTGASGRQMIGHEVKASRSDWLAELAKPGKADAWADQCHQWWVVAAPGVVKVEELPSDWGLLEPTATARTRMVVRSPAKVHADRVPSWLATRSVMSRFDTLRAEAIRDAKAQAYNDVQAERDQDVERLVANRMRGQGDAVKLQTKLDLIEKALGAKVHTGHDQSWTGAAILSLADLALVGAAARDGKNLRAVLTEIARPYNTPLAVMRRQLDALQVTLDACQAQAITDITDLRKAS